MSSDLSGNPWIIVSAESQALSAVVFLFLPFIVNLDWALPPGFPAQCRLLILSCQHIFDTNLRYLIYIYIYHIFDISGWGLTTSFQIPHATHIWHKVDGLGPRKLQSTTQMPGQPIAIAWRRMARLPSNCPSEQHAYGTWRYLEQMSWLPTWVCLKIGYTPNEIAI